MAPVRSAAALAVLLLQCASSSLANAQAARFTVSKSFSEHALLQAAPASARVWGWAAPGSTVSTFLNCSRSGGDTTTFNTTARADGLWVAEFPPQPASPHACVVAFTDSASGASVWYLDILFGTVLFCGGQSNMDLNVGYIFNASVEIARAASYSNSVRLLQLPLQAFSVTANSTPLDEFLAVIPWVPASSTSIGGFSAECWLTAAGLFDAVYASGGGSIPVGAIQSDWPGNSITQLSSPAAMAVPCAGDAAFASAPSPGFPGPIPGPGPVSSQYNAMVAPLAVGPLAVGAFIYHQGEADVHGWFGPTGPLTYDSVRAWYACRLRALIADFRETFAASPPALPWFGVSMLAPYAGDCGAACAFVPAVRAAQMDVALSEPNVTCAVLVDGGDPTAPAGSVHSRNKQVVAKRLVTGAMATLYGGSKQQRLGGSAPLYGPTYASAADSGAATPAGSVAADVAFSAASTLPGGLELVLGVNGTSWCPVGQSPSAPTLSECAWFAVQGRTSGWLNVTEVTLLNASAVRLVAPLPGGGSDVAVATAWAQNSYPVSTLYANGLPATPWNVTL